MLLKCKVKGKKGSYRSFLWKKICTIQKKVVPLQPEILNNLE